MVSIGEGTRNETQLRTGWGLWGQKEAMSIAVVVIGLVAKERREGIFKDLVAVVNRDALGHGPLRDGWRIENEQGGWMFVSLIKRSAGVRKWQAGRDAESEGASQNRRRHPGQLGTRRRRPESGVRCSHETHPVGLCCARSSAWAPSWVSATD